jgi:hypothetical protein
MTNGLRDESDSAHRYAVSLLARLGLAEGHLKRREPGLHPAIGWARSGAMALTGRRDGPARLCLIPLAACAEGTLQAFEAIGERPFLSPLFGSALLTERAAIAGLTRNGTISPGGSCRLLQARDGWIAANLSRPDDWGTVPAWLEADIEPGWTEIAAAVRTRNTGELLDQGRLLGLAVAVMNEPAADRGPWQIARSSNAPAARRRDRPLVLDLTALWAGPLCCHLLHAQGARVIKVENIHRPDGARHGPAQFYDLLNAGKDSVALDLKSADGLAQLRRLIEAADIVVESSRPRALRQLGIEAEEMVASVPGLTWVGITGYGREEPEANWIAFGDDAGVAAGLSFLVAEPDGTPNFCADAIADPLTGLHAALAAWHCWQSGTGGLVSVSLRDVAAHCANFDRPAGTDAMQQRRLQWQEILEAHGATAAGPTARMPAGAARPLGADTATVLSEFRVQC